jgi:hypothetical protein
MDNMDMGKIDGTRSMSIHINPLKTKDSQVLGNDNKDLAEQIEKNITLMKTTMTP